MSFNLMPAYFAIVCMLANKCSTVAKMGDRLATIDMDQKLECCAPFFLGGGKGELSPCVTQCDLGRGLPSYKVASRSIQPFGHNRYGPKIGKGCAPFGRGSWVPI